MRPQKVQGTTGVGSGPDQSKHALLDQGTIMHVGAHPTSRACQRATPQILDVVIIKKDFLRAREELISPSAARPGGNALWWHRVAPQLQDCASTHGSG